VKSTEEETGHSIVRRRAGWLGGKQELRATITFSESLAGTIAQGQDYELDSRQFMNGTARNAKEHNKTVLSNDPDPCDFQNAHFPTKV